MYTNLYISTRVHHGNTTQCKFSHKKTKNTLVLTSGCRRNVRESNTILIFLWQLLWFLMQVWDWDVQRTNVERLISHIVLTKNQTGSNLWSTISRIDDDYQKVLYFPSYARMGPYIMGLFTGYLLYRTKCKLHMPKVTSVAVFLSAIIILFEGFVF